jgi:hypothetical protein
VPVLSVEQGQDVDPAGTLLDVFTAQFTLAGKPGTFTAKVVGETDWAGRLIAEIQATAADVATVYGAI